MILGHVRPLSVCVTENELITSPQLSVALPPPAIKAAYELKTGGTDPTQTYV
jgi:hypothetical protein